MNTLIQLQAFIEIDILYVVQLASENAFVGRYIDKMWSGHVPIMRFHL